MRPLASARWPARSPGATSSSGRRSVTSCTTWRSSRTASTSNRPSGSSATTSWWRESDVLERLIALADQSLIVRDVTSTGVDVLPLASGIRFTMLRTVQGFAAEQLVADGHEADVRRRHAETFLDLARAAAARFQGSAQPLWLDRLGLDHGNLRAALEWSTSAGETEIALGMVGALWRFWLLDGRLHEGSGWAERVLAMAGADAPTPGATARGRGRGQHRLLAEPQGGLLTPVRGGARPGSDPRRSGHGRRCGVQPRVGLRRRWRRRAWAGAAWTDARRRYEGSGDARAVNRVAWAECQPDPDDRWAAALPAPASRPASNGRSSWTTPSTSR